MSIADQLERIAAATPQAATNQRLEEGDQIRDLQEVEAALKEIGVTLEPMFNISLAARIGATAPSKETRLISR